MRIDEGRAVSEWRPAAGGETALPAELAFLLHELDRERLERAAKVAETTSSCPASVLVADGCLSAARYYRALARYLDLEFIDDWPEIETETDVASAHAVGWVALAHDLPARWLAAPRDEDLRALLAERNPGPRRSDVAITTPSHFASVIHFHSQSAIEQAARDRLPDETPRLSARDLLRRVRSLVALAGIAFVTALVVEPRALAEVLGLLFLTSIIFRLLVAARGVEAPCDGPPAATDADLPVYTVLVPLVDEGDILPDLLVALQAIDYPRAKLEVLMLIEPEDHRMRRALAAACLPPWLHVVVGPWGGGLRTKPRALNIGLLMARGDLLTVFDAEDRPDANQLRLAAAMFAQLPRSVACLQARLAIDNGSESLLARMFALEYAFLFDVLNVGIGSLQLPMALGGTSNHFRTSSLREAGGWDAWNVTEDADLGLRLARLGFGVACLPSTTLEVAPERLGAWMKQRRRWMKGWIQTFLVLARDAPRLTDELGPFKSGALALLLVNLVVAPLLFPFLSALVAYNLVRSGIPNPTGAAEVVEATIGTLVLVLGIGSVLWSGYIGARARKLESFLPSVPLVLPYQLITSAAAWMGLWDLIWKPHHWHKTKHAARSDKAVQLETPDER